MSKKEKMNFIRTTDESTAEQLRKYGYTELTESSSTSYCFVNDGKMMFEEEVRNKIVYSNVLCI